MRISFKFTWTISSLSFSCPQSRASGFFFFFLSSLFFFFFEERKRCLARPFPPSFFCFLGNGKNGPFCPLFLFLPSRFN